MPTRWGESNAAYIPEKFTGLIDHSHWSCRQGLLCSSAPRLDRRRCRSTHRPEGDGTGGDKHRKPWRKIAATASQVLHSSLHWASLTLAIVNRQRRSTRVARIRTIPLIVVHQQLLENTQNADFHGGPGNFLCCRIAICGAVGGPGRVHDVQFGTESP